MRKKEIDYILRTILEAQQDVSDINITVGRPLQVESAGKLIPVSFNPSIHSLTPFQTEIFALSLINSDKRLTHTLVQEGSCDFSYEVPGLARFRVNVFSQRHCLSAVMRKLPTSIPTIKELKLPNAFEKMAQEKNGIILVTGATGSGKSTSLAALLNEINENQAVHIITLEDPVEFVHPHKQATFNQRELGADFDTFANGLRAALRQAPKVILVGEMRDRETVEIGLMAAETGHLVLSTLHTIDAGQTVNRMVGMFNQEEERQVRIRLADTVRWIVSQRLLPKIGGGRVAVFEVLGSNLSVKECIINGESEDKTFYGIMEASEAFGMQTFDKDILEAYKNELITEEVALAYASKRPVVRRGIDKIKSEKGVKTTTIEGLAIDEGYGRKDEGSLL
ncbi:MAG TPA: PilT/PilU family type 4a pilus ATPase [Syntrophaceae bacterium]|nr:PilT/PilU family type 4a pilus ATPase [Syntrophaceae bacterium]